MTATGSVDFSIVVVAWECEGHLSRLVASMNRHLGDDVELVVVDNGSSDRPGRAAGAWKGRRRLIELGSNRGYGAAANIGVGAARGEAVVMLNPDTELLDGGIRELASLALGRGALTGPRLLYSDRTRQPSACGPIAGPWPWVRALVPGGLLPPALLRRTEPWRLERTVEVSWLCGACIAGPRERLRELGPFDPAFHLYGEDVDLGLRASAAGIPSLFCPQVCSLVHVGQGSTSVRWSEGPAEPIEVNWRAAVRRSVGPARERRAWRARRVYTLRRVAGKRVLGQDASWERAVLTVGRTPGREGPT